MTYLKNKWVVGICAVFLVFFLSKYLRDRSLPEKLHGAWENSDPDYFNRYFLLEKNRIGFGTENGDIDWYEIVRVDEKVNGNKILYIINYQKPGSTVMKKSIYYYPAGGGKIKFTNQMDIEWFLDAG